MREKSATTRKFLEPLCVQVQNIGCFSNTLIATYQGVMSPEAHCLTDQTQSKAPKNPLKKIILLR